MVIQTKFDEHERPLGSPHDSLRVGATQTDPAGITPLQNPRCKLPSVAAILVQYDRQRYPAAQETLRLILKRLSGWKRCMLLVDNKNESMPFTELGPEIFRVGGDNSVHEFSGWMKGLRELQGEKRCFDAYLLVTDAFQAYGDDYAELAKLDSLFFALERQAVAGIIDASPPNRHYQVRDSSLRYWVRSSFMWIPSEVLQQTGTVISVFQMGEFCDPEFVGNAFHADAPLSAAYQEYVEEWLTSRWHSAFHLSQSTWQPFKDKARSILNEHLLTIRWQNNDTRIYDLRFLVRLRRALGYSLDRVKVGSLEQELFDPIEQLAYGRSSRTRRKKGKWGRLVGRRAFRSERSRKT